MRKIGEPSGRIKPVLALAATFWTGGAACQDRTSADAGVGTTAHPAVVIDDEVSCSSCIVTLDLHASLSAEYLRPDTWVSVDSRGLIYFAPVDDDHDVLAVNPDGTLEHVLDLPTGDSASTVAAIYLDPESNRLNIIDTAAHWFVLSSDWQITQVAALQSVPYDMAFVSKRRAVAQLMIFTSDRIGFPLQLLSYDGSATRSFGADPALYLRRDPQTRYRALAESRSGRVWCGYVHRYDLELWDTAGFMIASLRRDASWFPPRFKFLPGEPLLVDLRQDARGLLWTLVDIPDSTSTSKSMGSKTRPEGPVDWRQDDSIIEIIDPSAGKLLGRIRVDKALLRYSGDYVYSVSRGGGGPVTVDIWRVHLGITSTEGRP